MGGKQDFLQMAVLHQLTLAWGTLWLETNSFISNLSSVGKQNYHDSFGHYYPLHHRLSSALLIPTQPAVKL